MLCCFILLPHYISWGNTDPFTPLYLFHSYSIWLLFRLRCTGSIINYPKVHKVVKNIHSTQIKVMFSLAGKVQLLLFIAVLWKPCISKTHSIVFSCVTMHFQLVQWVFKNSTSNIEKLVFLWAAQTAAL